jgi:DNA-binding response OmpR family regulator
MADAPTGHDRAQNAPPFVMVVDDDPAVLATLERLLMSWGYQTLAIGTFEEARAALTVDPPQVLVTDVRLQEYNGLQLVHLLKQLRPSAVVATLSGIDDPVLRTEAANAGAPYFVKPEGLLELRAYLAGEIDKSPRPS